MLTFNTTDENNQPMYIFVFTATGYEGNISECDEGELRWIENEKLLELNLWQGDRLFWGWILNNSPFFSANFLYEGDALIKHEVKFY